jgi:hypothetical protein
MGYELMHELSAGQAGGLGFVVGQVQRIVQLVDPDLDEHHEGKCIALLA